jgi:hypothetical protein
MGVPQPSVSPVMQEFGDYVGKYIRITVTFDNATRVLSGITVFRDAGCQFNKILIGLGEDGVPDHSSRTFTVPTGTTVLNPAQMNAVRANGMNTIEEFESFQITAGR